MASFDGASFLESSQDGYPSYPKADIFNLKDRPNELPAVHEVGMDVQRATIAILVTGAQLAALYAKHLDSGSLVMDWETNDAFLAGIGETNRVGMEDLYESSLDVIRL